jgi:hypothetical protein
MSHCALRRAWEGGSHASCHALVSPETGLVTKVANIAAGDWCIAVGNGTQAKFFGPPSRRDHPFTPSTFNSHES